MAKEAMLERVAQHLTGKHITLIDSGQHKQVYNEKVTKAIAIEDGIIFYFDNDPNNWAAYIIGRMQHIINHDCEKKSTV